MTKIVIPTYNRSAKLSRTLGCYFSFGSKFFPEIVVLDGSSSPYLEENKRICSQYPGIDYIASPGSSFLSRLVDYFDRNRGSFPICLGTDEDVFLPNYLTDAAEFLDNHADYSMFVGRYITFLKPLGPLNRISHQRDVITSLDICQEELARRIVLLSNAVSAGCAPFFWGVRRSDQLRDSLILQKELYYQSSQELIDQIILAYQGKVMISKSLMLLRDETNLDYVVTEDRHDPLNYFPVKECDHLLELLHSLGGESLVSAANLVLDKYILNYVSPGKPCLAIQAHKKTYLKYEPICAKSNALTVLIASITMKVATVFSEILTAMRDIRQLRTMYSSAAINNFSRKIRSNQI